MTAGVLTPQCTLADLWEWAWHSPEADAAVSVAFVTRQGVRHEGRRGGYRNEVVSLRLEAVVGSAACEPGEVDDEAVFACAGQPVRALLRHDSAAIRTAALDALLQHAQPVAGSPVVVPAGSSVAKSRARARVVVDLLPDLAPGSMVAVVGVVNSLLAELRARGLTYVACDLKGGQTEWGEEVVRDAATALAACDAMLVSGMTLANGTFSGILEHAQTTRVPLVVFAQTGAGVFPHLVGSGVTAVSAEPYPFFWLGGEPSVVHLHREPGEPR